jgi:hypothetical protein
MIQVLNALQILRKEYLARVQSEHDAKQAPAAAAPSPVKAAASALVAHGQFRPQPAARVVVQPPAASAKYWVAP